MYKNITIEVDIAEFDDEEIIDAIWHRDLSYVFEREQDISDYDDETLIGAMKYRSLSLIDDDTMHELNTIVQKHRCGLPWQAEAIEFLYNMANKVI